LGGWNNASFSGKNFEKIIDKIEVRHDKDMGV
jgi:hypothetical protein